MQLLKLSTGARGEKRKIKASQIAQHKNGLPNSKNTTPCPLTSWDSRNTPVCTWRSPYWLQVQILSMDSAHVAGFMEREVFNIDVGPCRMLLVAVRQCTDKWLGALLWTAWTRVACEAIQGREEKPGRQVMTSLCGAQEFWD